MKNLASGYWKTVVSRGRGCIFQGFHCLQKVGKTTPEIVSKWHKKCLKVGSEGSQKRRWHMQGKLRKLDEKRSPKWGIKKLVFCLFLVLFWGLGPKVSQGGPRDTPRVPPGSKLLQNGSQNDWKTSTNVVQRLSENVSQRHAIWACFQIALVYFLFFPTHAEENSVPHLSK